VIKCSILSAKPICTKEVVKIADRQANIFLANGVQCRHLWLISIRQCTQAVYNVLQYIFLLKGRWLYVQDAKLSVRKHRDSGLICKHLGITGVFRDVLLDSTINRFCNCTNGCVVRMYLNELYKVR
jgi:hypothetical protein